MQNNNTPGLVSAYAYEIRRLVGPLLQDAKKKKWKLDHKKLFPVVLLYDEILLRLYGGTPLFSHFIYPLIIAIACGLLLTAVTSALRRKYNRIISIVFLFGTALLFIVETLVKRQYMVYMTIDSLTQGAGGVVGDFTSELISAIWHGIPAIILFFLPGILYVLFGKRRMPARRYPRQFLCVLLIGGLCLLGIGTFAEAHGSSKTKYSTQYEFDAATEYFGLLTSVRLSAKASSTGGDVNGFVDFPDEAVDGQEASADGAEEASVDEAADADDSAVDYGDNVTNLPLGTLIASEKDSELLQLHQYVESVQPTNKNKYTGLFEGKNIIMICAEGFSDAAIMEELTPTLYRMQHNGIYFSEYYQPNWGGSTSSGEFSFITGIPPMSGTMSMLNSSEVDMSYTLANQLKKLGYYCPAYHSGNPEFYSRNLTHPNFGFDFIAPGNGLEDTVRRYAEDTALIEGTIDRYIDQQPFCTYYMTLSGHFPYEEDERTAEYLDYVVEKTGGKYKNVTNYYFCYNMYLEKAVTELIAYLEEAGIADDTLIVLTADHYPYGLEQSGDYGTDQSYIDDLYGYDWDHPWERDRNALIVWSTAFEGELSSMICEISEPVYSLDILPTLMNLMGVEYDSRLLVGRDVFSDTEGLCIWRNYSWVTAKGKYDSGDETFYPNDGVTVDESYVERINAVVANKLAYGSKVMSRDYYSVILKED